MCVYRKNFEIKYKALSAGCKLNKPKAFDIAKCFVERNHSTGASNFKILHKKNIQSN